MERLQETTFNTPTNRVAEAIYLYAEQEAQFKISNPVESRYGREPISLKLQYYGSVFQSLRKQATPQEKHSLRYLKHEMAKMRSSLNPNFLNKVLYSTIVNKIRNFIKGNSLFFSHHDKAIKALQKEIFLEDNLHNVSTEMKKAGFKFEMEGTLKKMLNQNLSHFHVCYADIQNRQADFVLHFAKIPGTEKYYFEKFDALARPSLDALLRKDPNCKRHTFSLTNSTRFVAKEAEALVNGKSVCKNVNGKDTWMVLESDGGFRTPTLKQVSFDLDKALHKLPLKNLDNPSQYKSITEALKSGIQKEVIFMLDGAEVKYSIEASPLKKSIDILDKDNKAVALHKLTDNVLNGITRSLVQKTHQDAEVIDMPHQQKRKGKAL